MPAGATLLRGRFSSFCSVVVLLSLALMSFNPLLARNGLDGVYTGFMDLNGGAKVPLAVSLSTSNESTDTPRGSEFVIDGSCVIDEEGGPYTFVKVSYNIDDNTLDLRYNRPYGDLTAFSPASFRLSGGFTGEGIIQGEVKSGTYSVIGTFSITKDPSQTMLKTREKYVGEWKGKSYNHFAQEENDITLFISKGISLTTNPPNYEFDYTPGKMAGYKTKDIAIASFSRVAIDYLRRTVLLQDTLNTISMLVYVNFETKTVSGESYTTMHGHTMSFKDLILSPSRRPLRAL